MAKETDGRGRAPMNEADLEYLRNINTRPGPNAGRSIDPSKPGPDAALAQSDAEPVAWQYRIKQGGWGGWHEAAPTKDEALACINAQIKLNLVDEYELRPLYAAPPRPDTSAGLIEAAEWHEELAKEKLKQAKQAPEAKKRRFLDISFFHDECASALRACAAERNGS